MWLEANCDARGEGILAAAIVEILVKIIMGTKGWSIVSEYLNDIKDDVVVPKESLVELGLQAW